MKRSGICILLFYLVVLLLQAENIKMEVPVFFRNDVDKIDPSYSGNSLQLHTLDSIFAVLDSCALFTLRSVELTGWASPPASVQYNIDLSHRRALEIQRWLKENCGLNPELTEIRYNGVNYPLLSRMVRERNYRYRDEVLAITDDVPASPAADNRLPRLRKLRNGLVWKELTRDYYPAMRRTDVVINYDYTLPSPVEEFTPECDTIALVVEQPEELPQVPEQPLPVPAAKRNFYMSLHTNMLYDLLAVPNLGCEAYLGRNLSIAANWQYAWWKSDRLHRYWRTYGGYLSFRYWMGSLAKEKPLTGHHIGLYGQVLLYDFEWGGIGYLSGTPGKNIFHHPTWGYGVEYGFALPVGRRLNIDFTVGVGHLSGRYWKYEPSDDHYKWLSIHNRNYWGVTKLEVSLVWLFGRGNYNAGKGGAR